MKKSDSPTPTNGSDQRLLRLERTYQASVADVWELWTTAEGIESWWGPVGFTVKVREINLRTGGTLVYAMTASGAEQVEFMKQAGMPLTTEVRIKYREVILHRKLAYTTLIDFVVGTQPYDCNTLVEFQPEAGGVKMVLAFDPMHSDEWTQNAIMGHEGELTKLDEIIRRKRGHE